jgi:hypothetical protein
MPATKGVTLDWSEGEHMSGRWGDLRDAAEPLRSA